VVKEVLARTAGVPTVFSETDSDLGSGQVRREVPQHAELGGTQLLGVR
jgi:hypothetical protein